MRSPSRLNKPTLLCSILAYSLWASAIDGVAETNRQYVLTREGKRAEPIVAVDNVCAWPNLTLLKDGTIISIIHNQPSHLKMPADVECWASEDGGRTWMKRGTPAPRDNERVAREMSPLGWLVTVT